MPRPVSSSMRMTPALSGIARTVLPRTYRSYCDVTHVLLARFGEPASHRTVRRSSSPLDGRVRRPGVSDWSAPRSFGGSIGRRYTGPSSAAVVGGMSTIVSPRHVMTRRPVSVTVPITVAGISQRAQISRKRSTLPGSTTAIMRSCDSLMRISSGVSVASRSGMVSRSTCMPPVPAAASSVVAQETPAAPRSWMPTTRSSLKSSRQHSMSSFSMKGSPTCTDGRFCCDSSSNVAEARTDAPPIPSGPVSAPKRITLLPGPGAVARWMSSCFITPTHSALTSGFCA